MCGIAGLIGDWGGRASLERMLPPMHHRGPDGEGIWADDNNAVFLGHKRLSIIDLDGGAQPMHSPDGRYVLTYNGEVYNYRELRPDLERKGWAFKTASDSEVLLAGLAYEGVDFLAKIIGMFAFALWDRRERTLLLARDRVGIKPLYLARLSSGRLAFGSELKSLLTVPGLDRGLNGDALGHYLTQRFVPAPLTMVRGIEKFPPGHYGVYENGELSIRRYWNISFQTNSNDFTGADRQDVQKTFKDLLTSAVELRLRSDVPYGAFLSGGVDSSLIAGLMARASPEPVRTYSIGFDGIDDERADARAVAKALGTNHREIELTPNDLRRLPDVVWSVDEPFPDPIVLAMTLLAEKASEDVKVILTGEGADELLGGYVHHPHLHLLSRLAPWAPPPLPALAGWMANRLPLGLVNALFNYPADLGKDGRRRLANLVRNMGHDAGRYLSYVSLFTGNERTGLLSDAILHEMMPDAAPETSVEQGFAGTNDEQGYIDRVWTYEYKTWLPDNILFKQDKTLMAHSIEGRVPFCDHRLVEFAAKLPLKFRFSKGRSKALLRDVAADVLKGVPQAANKKAFMVPLHGAYGKVMRDMAGDILGGTRFRNNGVFKPQAIDTLLAHLAAPSFLAGKQIMALVMFGLWEESVFGQVS